MPPLKDREEGPPRDCHEHLPSNESECKSQLDEQMHDLVKRWQAEWRLERDPKARASERIAGQKTVAGIKKLEDHGILPVVTLTD